MKKKAATIASELVFFGITIITWIPIYYFVIGAFKTREDIVMYPLTVDFERMSVNNFIYVWKNMNIGNAIGNTGLITLGALAMIVLVSSLAGFSLARLKGKFFRFSYQYVVTLMVVPFISCLLMLVRLSTKLGTYNTVFGSMLIHAAWHVPFCTFLYTGFMKSIPGDLEEAAYIDGCSTFKIYRVVFLPLLAPVTATCCIRSGITIWNDYLVSKTLLNSVRTPTLMVSISSFFGEYVSEYGYAFAGIVIASLPITIIFVFLQKYFIKGLTAGAVKG